MCKILKTNHDPFVCFNTDLLVLQMCEFKIFLLFRIRNMTDDTIFFACFLVWLLSLFLRQGISFSSLGCPPAAGQQRLGIRV